jgi:hypothetical protein
MGLKSLNAELLLPEEVSCTANFLLNLDMFLRFVDGEEGTISGNTLLKRGPMQEGASLRHEPCPEDIFNILMGGGG